MPAYFPFIEDGVPVEMAALRVSAAGLAARIPARRFAVYTNRPSVIATCLIAAIDSGRELLLLRSPTIPDADIGAIVDDALDVHSIPGAASAESSEPAILIPTSGTSGVPKIARHRIDALLGRIRSTPARWLLTYQPHGFAGLQMILTALETDAVLVCLSSPGVPRLAEAALAHRVTHISGTPTFWRSFLLCLGAPLDLEQITLGGEIADQSTLDRLRAAFPRAAISHIYASTEAGAVFSVRDGLAGFPAEWLDKISGDVALRIRDGILEVRSPRAMLSYVNHPGAAHTPDGWLITGDRVEVRAGRVFFLGREDSVINVGGAKVTPEEIESALLDISGIVDLRAFAAPNPITGFVVGLDVAAAPGFDAAELRQSIQSAARARLAPYKVPRLIRFVDVIASDPSGKKSRLP